MRTDNRRDIKKTVDTKKLEELETLIDNTMRIEKFCASKGHQLKPGKNQIPCYFHPDESPSMFIDVENQRWNCRSCGLGGRYITFVMYYNANVTGLTMDYNETIEYILRENSDLRAMFSGGIYKEDDVIDIVKNFSTSSIEDAFSSYMQERQNAVELVVTSKRNRIQADKIPRNDYDAILNFCIEIQEKGLGSSEILDGKVDNSLFGLNLRDILKKTK